MNHLRNLTQSKIVNKKNAHHVIISNNLLHDTKTWKAITLTFLNLVEVLCNTNLRCTPFTNLKYVNDPIPSHVL